MFKARQATRARGRMLIVFGPVLAVGAFGALLAMAAAHTGWHPELMRLIATALGATVTVLAVVLFYQQTGQRRASDLALHSAQAQVDDVVEAAMDAIITVDENQRIVLFNRAAESVFGYERSTVLGQSLDVLMPASVRDTHHEHIKSFGRTGVTSRRMGDQTVLVGRRIDGEEFPIEASISQHSENGLRFFTVILRDVTDRVRVETALRRSKDELHEMAAAASSVREQEKSRVARELHDELAQALTALKMDVTWLKERTPAEQQPVLAKLESMQNILDTTVKATRRISSDLRPLMLDDLGLIPAAEWLVNNFIQRHGIDCQFTADPPDLALQDPHATAIFRIMQESLTNVARHAHASTVDITLDASDGEITLRVRDNGRGFAAGDPRKPNSFGLVGLRERVYLLDGEIRVDTAPGKGATIEVRIPMPQGAASA
ncbi:MAG: PAS domain-containing sensor histidine kinase [Betaproteobacteria bacterium]